MRERVSVRVHVRACVHGASVTLSEETSFVRVTSRKPVEGLRAGLGKFWVQPDHSTQTSVLGRMKVEFWLEKR